MTSDDILSMLKATEKAIENMSIILDDGENLGFVELAVADSIRSLATIQRDLLKAVINDNDSWTK